MRDEQPLLYHTGMRGWSWACGTRWRRRIHLDDPVGYGFSHFEADECGALKDGDARARGDAA